MEKEAVSINLPTIYFAKFRYRKRPRCWPRSPVDAPIESKRRTRVYDSWETEADCEQRR